MTCRDSPDAPTLPTSVRHLVTTRPSPDHVKNVTAAERDGASTLFRRVYVLLLLRNVAVTVSECFAIFDESVSAFFAGTTGLIVAGAIWLVQTVLAALASVSDVAFNRHRLAGLLALECVACAGAAANVYHSYEMHLADIVTTNAVLGAFQLGHIAFFFNPWLDYNAVYGLVGGATIAGCALAVASSSGAFDWLALAGAGLGFACCAWHSLETHAFVGVRKRAHRFDCYSVVLCIAYVDVWNVVSKCTFAGATVAAAEVTKSNGDAEPFAA